MTVQGKGLRQIAAMLLLCLAAMACVTLASAQEVLPDAPPELEGFRLDAPPSEPAETPPPTTPPTAQPETPEPAPTGNTPPASEPADTQTSRSAPPRPVPAASGRPPAANGRQPVPANNRAAPAIADDLPGDVPATTLPTEIAPPEAQSGISDAADNADQTAQPPTGGMQTSWIFWFAVAAISAILALALYLFSLHRRKQAAAAPYMEPRQMSAEPKAGAPIEDDAHIQVIAADAAPEIPEVRESPAKAKPRSKPELDMRFIPERAVLGMVNLTIKGELKIVNHGKAMARNVRLRSAAICACPSQPAMIAAFNAGEMGPQADAIDNIRKGERLSVAIEVSLPKAELESYNYDGRQICVPIILAEIAYSGMRADSGQHVQIAAMVGREANPPADKMGPLRIDLGPRSFDALGQRPVTA